MNFNIVEFAAFAKFIMFNIETLTVSMFCLYGALYLVNAIIHNTIIHNRIRLMSDNKKSLLDGALFDYIVDSVCHFSTKRKSIMNLKGCI